MLTISSGRPKELIKTLGGISSDIKHLRIETRTHFWHTEDDIIDLVHAIRMFHSLEILEMVGESYSNLEDTVRFLTILRGNQSLRILKMNIQPPFPGQYCIQDRHYFTNTIMNSIYYSSCMKYAMFDTKEQNEWVDRLNIKLKSILRTRDNPVGKYYNDMSHL